MVWHLINLFEEMEKYYLEEILKEGRLEIDNFA